MSNNYKKYSKYDPIQQLEYLKLQSISLKEKLYNSNAQYLNVIRSYLPDVIKQAVFLLITDQHDYHVDLSSLESRKACFKKIDQLVANTNSILTVEHLMHKAEDLQKEKNLKIQNIQLDDLDVEDLSEYDYISSKSIEISSLPPLENNISIENYFKDNDSFFKDDLSFDLNNSSYFNKEDNEDIKDSSNSFIEQSVSRIEEKSHKKNNNKGLDTLKKLLMMASDAITPDNKVKFNNKVKTSVGENSSDNKFLPETPMALFYWMNSIELALIRDLRNLSNSINIELLRSGLINNLMPVSLLDAVISGEVSSQDSPSNLLKLEVPVTTSNIHEKVEVSCLLINLSDMEFDNPSLRKSKSYLKKYRNLLMKMIKQERHWHNRSLANEVSQQWLQNPQEIQTKNI